jgi:carboxymethylenebutenolidase
LIATGLLSRGCLRHDNQVMSAARALAVLLVPSHAALGVDLFEGRNRAVCMARMFAGGMAGNLDYYGVPALKAALGRLVSRPEVDAARIGAIGFCLGGSIVLTWACTDNRLAAIAPFYGAAPKPRAAIRRMCPVVGSWPGKDFTTKAAGVLDTELTAAGIPHDLKVYPRAKHAFFNDQWRAYHPAAAADSWQRVLALFAEHVRRGPAVTRAKGQAGLPAGLRRSPGIASTWSRFGAPCGRPVARTAGRASASSPSGAPASSSS